MLQAHSFLWDYLWIAPNMLLLGLGVVLWRRRLHRRYPAFLAFALIGSFADLARLIADIAPFVSPVNYWRFSWAVLVVDSLLKVLVVAEIFSRTLSPYSSLSHLGRKLVSGCGAVLVLCGVSVSALSPGGSQFVIISNFHIAAQTVLIVELGLAVFVFAFVAYFHLPWDRFSVGIMLGFGITWCEYLVNWALVANANPSAGARTILDLLSMATFHICVVLWYYYLLAPAPVVMQPPTPATDHSLDLWNRELERLLHQ